MIDFNCEIGEIFLEILDIEFSYEINEFVVVLVKV